MLTFLGLDYEDALLITLYFVVLGISFPKNQINLVNYIIQKFFVEKVKNQNV